MTLEAWVYPTATSGTWSTILLKEQPGALVYALYAASPTNQPGAVFNTATTASGERIVAGAAPLPLNAWSHLVATYDGTTLRLYINGSLVGTQPVAGAIVTSTGALRIGGNNVWGEYFQGLVDEVRIYNRALSPAEIQTDMSTPIVGGTTSVVSNTTPSPAPAPSPGTGQGSGQVEVPVPAPAPAPASGLVAAYAFNEGSGQTVSDASGNNNTATLGGGVAWTSQGRFGNALVFNGADFVSLPAAAALDLTTAMTLEAWVYPTATSGTWSTILLKEQPGALVYALYAASPTNQPSTVFNTATTASGERIVAGAAPLPLNAWSHLVATYDGTTLRLYINGSLVGTQPVAGAIVTSTGALRIGGNNVWGEYFQGLVDEVRIYNRALSPAEIQTDMNTPLAAQ
ncbi:MAG: hypothetical protein DMD96_00005 [Candidatus Rokuibacteriota bacterium]|nr:MAG: hypothetical protein DMD96_00005 [Candidatus Rokubacteria bacterium]